MQFVAYTPVGVFTGESVYSLFKTMPFGMLPLNIVQSAFDAEIERITEGVKIGVISMPATITIKF